MLCSVFLALYLSQEFWGLQYFQDVETSLSTSLASPYQLFCTKLHLLSLLRLGLCQAQFYLVLKRIHRSQQTPRLLRQKKTARSSSKSSLNFRFLAGGSIISSSLRGSCTSSLNCAKRHEACASLLLFPTMDLCFSCFTNASIRLIKAKCESLIDFVNSDIFVTQDFVTQYLQSCRQIYVFGSVWSCLRIRSFKRTTFSTFRSHSLCGFVICHDYIFGGQSSCHNDRR